MTHLAVLENRTSLVRKYLTILRTYSKLTKEQILHDITYRGAIERYLYLAIQSSIDLAEAYISYKRYRKPQNMRDAFNILHEHKKISRSLLEVMLKMTGFRNVIAHDYDKIDDEIFYDVFKHRLKDIRSLLSSLKT